MPGVSSVHLALHTLGAESPGSPVIGSRIPIASPKVCPCIMNVTYISDIYVIICLTQALRAGASS